MINWFNMPDEGLSNGGLFEVKELEVTENGTYETKGEMYNKVTVNVEGGGGETWNTVFEGSVTTVENEGLGVATLDYSELIEADTIKVTFNGTEYTCNKSSVGMGTNNVYGDDDFNFVEYPFSIRSTETPEHTYSTFLFTATPNTYTLKIEEPQSGGSSDFSTAEVTVTDNGDGTHIDLSGIMVDGEDLTTMNNVSSGTRTFEVVLYKGVQRNFFISTETMTSISGGISGTLEDGFTITGDCTFVGTGYRDV